MTNEEKPTTEHGPIPKWILVMWFFGIIWILYYIYTTSQNNPFPQ